MAMTKDEEIMAFLHERVFDPILNGDYDNSLKQGVRMTIMRMERLPLESKISYFWSAIIGTENSKSFARKMRAAGAVRFEEVMEDFRDRFDDRWFRA